MQRKWRLFVFLTIIAVSLNMFSGCACSKGDCYGHIESPMVGWPAEKIEEKEAPKKEVVEKVEENKIREVKEVKDEQKDMKDPKLEDTDVEATPEQPKEEPDINKDGELKEPKEEIKEPDDIDVPEPETKVAIESSFQAEKIIKLHTAHTIKYVINNTGDKDAAAYQVKIVLPEGLAFEDDQKKSEKIVDLKALNAGDSNTYEFKVIAKKEGKFTLKTEVLVEDASMNTNSFELEAKGAPALSVTIKQDKDRVNMESQFDYTIIVKNTGDVKLNDITVQDQLPGGLIYISSTPAGKHNEDKARVTWKIGDLDVGAEKTLILKVTAIEKTILVNKARARDANKRAKAQAEFETKVEAEIGLQVQHFDTTDPVEVGEKTTYVIEVSNQGFKDATNVKVVVTIPAESSYIESNVEGTDIPIASKEENKKVTFESIDALKPGKKIIFRVTVKVDKVGDLLNSAEITSDEFSKPILKQEATKSFAKQ